MSVPIITDGFLAQITREREEKTAQAKAEAKDLFLLLAIAGVESVTIYFDGSGDSGTIEDISCVVTGVDKPCALPSLNQEVEDWAYKLLEGTGVDWYNNDGGYGEINMDVKGKEFSFEVNQRTTTSEIAASGEVKI